MGIAEIIVAAIGLVTTIIGFSAGKYSGKKAALRVIDERTAAAKAKATTAARTTTRTGKPIRGANA